MFVGLIYCFWIKFGVLENINSWLYVKHNSLIDYVNVNMKFTKIVDVQKQHIKLKHTTLIKSIIILIRIKWISEPL